MLITENPFGDSGFRMVHRTDHTEVGRAALEARDRAAAPRASASSPAHRVALTYFAGVMFDPFDLDFGVELDDELFYLRVKAEACYETQTHDAERARSRMAVELGHIGRLFRTRYAESFVAEQPLLEARLPVPGPMLTLAGETGLQRL